MRTPGYSKIFSPDYEHDCCVCSHNTPETIHLLKEYDISIDKDVILKNNYCSSILTSKIFLKNLLSQDFFSKNGIQTFFEWKKIHKDHLNDLRNQ